MCAATAALLVARLQMQRLLVLPLLLLLFLRSSAEEQQDLTVELRYGTFSAAEVREIITEAEAIGTALLAQIADAEEADVMRLESKLGLSRLRLEEARAALQEAQENASRQRAEDGSEEALVATEEAAGPALSPWDVYVQNRGLYFVRGR
jgi:sensor domain CHASE-containing protein